MREHLVLRDRGCAFPNCGRPPAWCDAHHILPVEDGGDTTTVNLLLLCRFHHRLIHRSDWRIIMGDNETPLFIPPATVDPRQRPIPAHGRNMPLTT